MKFFYMILIIFTNTIFAQNTKREILSFEADTTRNEYMVRVGDISNDKTQVEVEVKCYMSITDYEGKSEKIEILGVKQKVSNGGNVFFGGELYEGDYVVSLSYVEKGKRIEKTINKSVKKS